MSYTCCVEIKAESVCDSVKRRCLTLGKLRDFISAVRNFSHWQAEPRAAILEHVAGRLILIGECVLVIRKVNSVVIGCKREPLLAVLHLLHNNSTEKLFPVVIE